MTPQYWTALVRALITAAVTWLSGFIIALTADVSVAEAALIGAGPAVAVLVARFGVEGTYDSARDGTITLPTQK